MFVIDTNLLLYAANRDAPHPDRARALLEEYRRGERAWFLTWGIIYELLPSAPRCGVSVRLHGVSEIRTADSDFHQFPFLRVVNPLASG